MLAVIILNILRLLESNLRGGIVKDNPTPPADSSLMDDKLIITIGIGI